MFARIRDMWETLRALWAMVREFFVRYFLPLHSDDDPEEEEDGGGFFRLDWGEDADDEEPRALPAPEPVTEAPPDDSPAEPPRPAYPGSEWPDPPVEIPEGDGQPDSEADKPDPK